MKRMNLEALMEYKQSFDEEETLYGYEDKWWEDDCRTLCKLEGNGSCHYLAECLASRMLDYMQYGGKVIPHVKYDVRFDGSGVLTTATTLCDNYCDVECEHSFSVGDYLKSQNIELGTNPILALKLLITSLEQLDMSGVTDWICSMLLFDYLVINNDRSLDNMSFIYNLLDKTFRLAPLFDNGLAFYSFYKFKSLSECKAIRDGLKFAPFDSNNIDIVRKIASDKILSFDYSAFKQNIYIEDFLPVDSTLSVEQVWDMIDIIIQSCDIDLIQVI